MDVQAYFEEWSRLPGETLRMAISTKHKSVRALLERITRGPSSEDSGNAWWSFGVPIPGVDVTVPGVEKPTAVGSYAELPLRGAFGPSFALHLWFYSSVPGWEDLQTLAGRRRDVRARHPKVGARRLAPRPVAPASPESSAPDLVLRCSQCRQPWGHERSSCPPRVSERPSCANGCSCPRPSTARFRASTSCFAQPVR